MNQFHSFSLKLFGFILLSSLRQKLRVDLAFRYKTIRLYTIEPLWSGRSHLLDVSPDETFNCLYPYLTGTQNLIHENEICFGKGDGRQESEMEVDYSDKNIQTQVYHDCLWVTPCSLRNQSDGKNFKVNQPISSDNLSFPQGWPLYWGSTINI